MSVKKGAMFRKVKVLKGRAKDDAKKMGLSPDDIVILFDDQHIEKVEGDPVSYLLKRAKGTSEAKKSTLLFKALTETEECYEYCPVCFGVGYHKNKFCKACNGTGKIRVA